MGLKKVFTIIILITTIIFMGCSNAGKSGVNSQIGTEYESSSEVLRKYKLEDFEHLAAGESTMCDLYKTVGVPTYTIPDKNRRIDVYSLDTGKYFCVIYIDWHKEDSRILDFTIDEMEVSDTGPEQNSTTDTEYERSSEEVCKYKLEDFDHIVVGESTMCDLYKTVGVSPYFWYLNTKIIDVYPLDNGKYFFVTYINYQIEDKLDFTIDKIEVRDQNSID